MEKRLGNVAGTVYFVEPGSRETAVNGSNTRFLEFLIELKGERSA